MRLPVAILALCLLPCIAAAQAPPDGALVEERAYDFPSYARAVETTDVERYASREAYDRAVGDRGFVFRKLKYASDGLKVTAYLYRPARAEGLRLPAVVFNRGSAVRGDIAPELIAFFHRLASEGFVVLAPLYRQSDGGEGRDEMGGADLNDLMNVVPLARALGFVDTGNLFLYGESRGGMMTYQAIRRGFPANAAAVFGALTDLEAVVRDRPDVYTPALLKQFWPDLDARREEIFRSRSALRWAESLGTPLLIMHGGADRAVSPSQSLALAQRLQELGKTYGLIIYPGDGHTLARNQQDRDRRAAEWFKTHLKR